MKFNLFFIILSPFLVNVEDGYILNQQGNSTTRRAVQFVSLDNKTTLGLDVSSLYVADGEVFNIDSPEPFPSFGPFEGLELTISMFVNLCGQYLGQWSSMDYDPSLSALFVPDPTADSPAAKKNQKGGLTSTQIAAISVVVPVLVLVVCACLGYIMWKNYQSNQKSLKIRRAASLGS